MCCTSSWKNITLKIFLFFIVSFSSFAGDVNIDVGNFTGRWHHPSVGWVSGNRTLTLSEGVHKFFVGAGGFFLASISATDEITSQNSIAATAGVGSLTFNTTPITIDPADFDGQWYISNADGVWRSGEYTLNLVLGITYHALAAGAGAFLMDLDESGNLISQNPNHGQMINGKYTFTTKAVTIDPSNFDGQWTMTRSNVGWTTSEVVLNLVPDLGYHFFAGGSGAHLIDFDNSGNLIARNSAHGQMINGKYTFNTVPVTIDPADFDGSWQVTRVDIGFKTEEKTLNLVPALSYHIYAGGAGPFIADLNDVGVFTARNPVHAQTINGKFTFNTTPVTFTPNNFDGTWRLNRADGILRTGEYTLNLVLGVTYQFFALTSPVAVILSENCATVPQSINVPGVAVFDLSCNTAPPTPEIDFSSGFTSNEGESLNIDISSQLSEGDLDLTYDWTFGDGSSASGVSVSHTYLDDGIYPVFLSIKDGEEELEVLETSTIVTNLAPVVSVTEAGNAVLGLAHIQKISVSDAGNDTLTLSYNLEGEDVTTVSNVAGEITISSFKEVAGTYNLSLTLTDDDGASTSQTIGIIFNSTADSITEIKDVYNLVPNIEGLSEEERRRFSFFTNGIGNYIDISGIGGGFDWNGGSGGFGVGGGGGSHGGGGGSGGGGSGGGGSGGGHGGHGHGGGFGGGSGGGGWSGHGGFGGNNFGFTVGWYFPSFDFGTIDLKDIRHSLNPAELRHSFSSLKLSEMFDVERLASTFSLDVLQDILPMNLMREILLNNPLSKLKAGDTWKKLKKPFRKARRLTKRELKTKLRQYRKANKDLFNKSNPRNIIKRGKRTIKSLRKELEVIESQIGADKLLKEIHQRMIVDYVENLNSLKELATPATILKIVNTSVTVTAALKGDPSAIMELGVIATETLNDLGILPDEVAQELGGAFREAQSSLAEYGSFTLESMFSVEIIVNKLSEAGVLPDEIAEPFLHYQAQYYKYAAIAELDSTAINAAIDNLVEANLLPPAVGEKLKAFQNDVLEKLTVKGQLEAQLEGYFNEIRSKTYNLKFRKGLKAEILMKIDRIEDYVLEESYAEAEAIIFNLIKEFEQNYVEERAEETLELIKSAQLIIHELRNFEIKPY